MSKHSSDKKSIGSELYMRSRITRDWAGRQRMLAVRAIQAPQARAVTIRRDRVPVISCRAEDARALAEMLLEAADAADA